MRYDRVLEEIEPKHRVWNPSTLEFEYVGDPVDPLACYRVSDMDDGAATKYYGYVDRYGNWYIIKMTSTAVRYCADHEDYETNWGNRATLEYDYLFNVF